MTPIEVLMEQFATALKHHNREEAVKLVKEALENQVVTIPVLYESILAPSLNRIASNSLEQDIPIWEEHISSNIVRTAMEVAFPYVIRARDAQTKDESIHDNLKKKALVFCLEEEYHELGARMTTDFLTLLDFEAYYIGANTPRQEIIKAFDYFLPDVICISITNYYHLAKLHAFIDQMKSSRIEKPFKLVLGGYAIHHSSNVSDLIKADYYVNTFEDLKKIKEDIL